MQRIRPRLSSAAQRIAGGVEVRAGSTRCSISAEADRAFAEFLRREPDAPVHRVLVIESRPASTAIAANLGIPHESPQAILLRDGVPVRSASHWDITAGALLTNRLERPGTLNGRHPLEYNEIPCQALNEIDRGPRGDCSGRVRLRS